MKSEVKNLDYEVAFIEAKWVSRQYLKARMKFIELSRQDNFAFLKGNDSIVGRIGEFIAFQYLVKKNRGPTKESLKKNNKGYDFLCSDNKRIQVKTITSESKYKQNSRLGTEWDEFILIKLTPDFRVERMGIITKQKLQEAVDDKNRKNKSMTPQVTEYMLTSGLMDEIKNVEQYL